MLTESEATALTAEIVGSQLVTCDLIIQAFKGQAWTALGYSTWASYCQSEGVGSHFKFPREERPDVVAAMREVGMSLRAIALGVGVGKDTVRDDLDRSGVGNQTPDVPRPTQGLDGKTYPAKPKLSPPDRVRKAVAAYNATDAHDVTEMCRAILAMFSVDYEGTWESYYQAEGIERPNLEKVRGGRFDFIDTLHKGGMAYDQIAAPAGLGKSTVHDWKTKPWDFEKQGQPPIPTFDMEMGLPECSLAENAVDSVIERHSGSPDFWAMYLSKVPTSVITTLRSNAS